jgi:hypothetical protein
MTTSRFPGERQLRRQLVASDLTAQAPGAIEPIPAQPIQLQRYMLDAYSGGPIAMPDIGST